MSPDNQTAQAGPHGWALTRTGTTAHYFWAATQAALPVAMCHNAIQAAPNSQLAPRVPAGFTGCPTCQQRLEQWHKDRGRALRVEAAQQANRLAQGVPVRVLSGKLAGASGEISRPEKSQEGFWWVVLLRDGKPGKELLFSKNQLQIN